MDRTELTQQLKQRAGELGFSLCGVCPAVSPPGAGRFDEWLAAGYAGQMHYLADRREAYDHPSSVLDGARSVVMLAMNYRTAEPAAPQSGQGRMSRYAWGDTDYHDLIRERLNALAEFVSVQMPVARIRGVVDTAPLLEREFGQLAGLGWIGKNTLLLAREHGSWFFLAALITDVELVYDAAHEADHCGTCRACLDACPTGAFPQPYVLDASRCISYLTIELREAIPNDLRDGVGDWVFGCDICQEVCPWNSRAPLSREAAFAPRADGNPIDLIGLFNLDEAAFRERFRHTPLWRPKRRGILRNAAIVLGNHPTAQAIPALRHGLNDAEPLVRGACAWALGRYPLPPARRALEQRHAVETDRNVLEEIEAALAADVDSVV
ncbi:MAG: tRNA epoxyqueuosine(34) reductase QueG [Pirellulales bacterium]